MKQMKVKQTKPEGFIQALQGTLSGIAEGNPISNEACFGIFWI
jgi:hypothetical protein